jgi:hypothetical protein
MTTPTFKTMTGYPENSPFNKALSARSKAAWMIAAAAMLACRPGISAVAFVQDDQGFIVTPERTTTPLQRIADQRLASVCRVLRITHDKGWFNDDDPTAAAPGWMRRCNLGAGDFNNDLTTSDTPDDVWRCSFNGSNVSVIAPRETGAGKIEIQIDGQTRATADLSTTGPRVTQQTVCEVTGLTPGKHSIAIINRGPGPVAVDALLIR